MDVIVLLEGFLIVALAAGVGLMVDWFAPLSAAIGAGLIVAALCFLTLTVASQFPGDT